MELETTIHEDKIEEPKKNMGDVYIWGIFIALCIISLVESYSASSREVSVSGIYNPLIKHGAMLLGGVFTVYVIQRFPYQKFIWVIPLFSVITVFLMVYVMVAGDVINGAKRAVNVLGFTLQPVEFAKVSIVLLIAWFMSKNQMVEGVKNKGVILCALAVMIYGALLFKQGLTNTILLMGISISMMLIGGVQWKKFFIVIIAYIIFGGGFLALTKDSGEKEEKEKTNIEETSTFTQEKLENREGTWTKRIDRFFSPVPLYTQSMTSTNQQEMFSYMAQANGGAIGVFPGNSRECSRLPLAFSDYIYSIIIEDVGCVGGIVVLILYLSLLARAGNIATKCSRAFPALLVIGMAVMIAFQALFHMAINTGVFPVSGQPLPLISKGGTSIFATAIAFGIMISVSKFAVQNNKSKDIKAEINNLPEDLRATNPTQLS
ncbi:MAG: FtsW/RodA/SpoVE family cell cycle protein [Muribaculaceae bacterium]